MSNENNNYDNSSDRRQELGKTFLYDVERKLPFWLKDEKDNITDILEELETHIWDRATELAEGGEPSEEQIELVICSISSIYDRPSQQPYRSQDCGLWRPDSKRVL